MKNRILRIPVIVLAAVIMFSFMPGLICQVNADSPTYTAPVKVYEYVLKKGKLKRNKTAYKLKYNKKGYITAVQVGKKTRDKFKYTYHANGALKKVKHQGVFYSFSDKGLLTNFDSGRYHEAYYYDSRNRLVKFVPSDTDPHTYEYTDYPDGSIHTIISYFEDAERGRGLESVTTMNEKGLITHIDYMHTNMVEYKYTYDKKGRVTSITTYETEKGKKTHKTSKVVFDYKKSKTKLTKEQYNSFMQAFTCDLGVAAPNGLGEVYCDIECL